MVSVVFGFLGFVLGLIVLIYVLSVIPTKLKLIIENQNVINKKLNEIINPTKSGKKDE